MRESGERAAVHVTGPDHRDEQCDGCGQGLLGADLPGRPERRRDAGDALEVVELDHLSGVHLGAMQADAAWTPPRGVRRTTTSTGSTDVANGASNHVAAVRPPAPRPGA
jgi:hypothetical protein